jgi:hypothetical protein
VRAVSLVWARFDRAARVFESAASLSLLAEGKRGNEKESKGGGKEEGGWKGEVERMRSRKEQ